MFQFKKMMHNANLVNGNVTSAIFITTCSVIFRWPRVF